MSCTVQKCAKSVLMCTKSVSCSAVCIPLCAIIFGAGSRSLELQLQAFPRRLLMMNVDDDYYQNMIKTQFSQVWWNFHAMELNSRTNSGTKSGIFFKRDGKNGVTVPQQNNFNIATWPRLWLWWSSWFRSLTDLTTCAHSHLVFFLLQHHRWLLRTD